MRQRNRIKRSGLVMSLLAAGLLLNAPAFAQNANITIQHNAGASQTGAHGHQPRHYRPHYRPGYRPYVPRPVAIPEKGSLYSTGQIGNYSAVPLPEDFRYEDTAPWRQFREVPVRREAPQRRVRSLDQNERKVRSLQNNVRRVRPFD